MLAAIRLICSCTFGALMGSAGAAAYNAKDLDGLKTAFWYLLSAVICLWLYEGLWIMTQILTMKKTVELMTKE